MFAVCDWLQQIDGWVMKQEAINPGGRQVGYCDGKIIRRDLIRSHFRHRMAMLTEHTCSLALDLFDRYGRLKQEFMDHPVKRGSGVWSAELDDDDIFLIEHLEIDTQYRRRGLGSKLVRAMLDEVEGKTLGYTAIVCPTGLYRLESHGVSAGKKAAGLTNEDISKSFWRSLGFRRIGSSAWFGLSLDKNHPSCHLTFADDYELPVLPFRRLDSGMQNDLLKAVQTSDNAYVEVLNRLFDGLARDDPRWKLTDADGNTVLHLAATKTRPTSVWWILSRTTELLQQRNNEGETPLDALQANLEDIRATHYRDFWVEDVSDYFGGFSDAAVSCLISLNGSNKGMDGEWQRLKYGCTCGRCISGFLSPRMRFALEYQAEILSDLLLEDINDGELWVESNSLLLDLISRRLRNKLKARQSMRKGFVDLLGHIAACMQKNMIPDEFNVETIVDNTRRSASGEFLRHGGSVETVATMLFQRAVESDELVGDSLHPETLSTEICRLPECRNDHEFGFVSGMCGYERVSAMDYV
jgi:ribosomal protein S18 acetylase RimI-like enzyme